MKIPSIENLRGVAALSVCVFHLTANLHLFNEANFIRKVSNYGYLGVQIFFVISGFVIPFSLYQAKYKIKYLFSFLLKRFIRIEPPYVASILLIVFLNLLSSKFKLYNGPPFHFEIIQFLCHLVYLPEHFKYNWYQPVYFTLLIEFEFYILLGLIYRLLTNSNGWVFCNFVIIVLLGSYLAKVELFAVIDVFLIGIIYFKYKIGHLKMYEFIFFEASIILFSGFDDPDINVPIIETLTLFGLLFWDRSNLATQFLGKISYSLYLIHIPIGG